MLFNLDISCRFLNKSLSNQLQSFGFEVSTVGNMCYVEHSVKPTIEIKTINTLMKLVKKAGNIKISEADSTIYLYEP